MAVSAKVASAYVDLVARTTAFEKALNDAQTHVRNFNRQAAAEMREAKGSVALLGEEVGIHLPRHLQTFIAKLPGVSSAMSAAFSTVAVLALVDVVFKAGEKLVEFIKKNEEAAKKNAAMWQNTIQPINDTNDKLELTNTKLENAIAKLEHKPQNKFKEAIEEATVAADELGRHLDGDIKKISEALKTQQTGWWSQHILHQTGANEAVGISSDIEDRFNQIAAGTFKGGTGDQTKDRDAVIRQALTEAYAKLGPAQIEADRVTANLGGKTSTSSSAQEVRTLTQLIAGLKSMLSMSTLTQDISGDQSKFDKLQGAREAAAEADKENQKRLEKFQLYVDQQKALGQMNVAQERAYWESTVHAFADGSKAYDDVQKKYFTASIALHHEFDAIRRRTIGSDDAAPEFKDDGRGADALAQATKQAALEAARLSARWTEARDKELLASGAIDAHTAALDIQAAHTAEYRAQLQALQDQLDELHQNDALAEAIGIPDRENLAKQRTVQTQIDKLKGERAITQMQDALRVTDTTWKGMIDDVFDEVRRKANGTSVQIRQIALHTIDSINTELAKGVTGGKMDFSKIFHEASQSLAKTGIEKVEGLIFGGSHKKADGYHVHVDNMPGGIPGADGEGGLAKQGAGGLLGMLNDSNWFSSLFGGRLFGAGSIFGGGFAMGGDVSAGVPIDVGELGPERFTPMVPGRITPNNEMRGGRGDMYVDARGTDPALSKANFERALRQTHAQSVATATHAMREAQLRRPH